MLALALLAAVAPAPRPAAAPVNTRYKFVSTSTQVIDQTVIGGPRQEVPSGNTVYFTLTVNDSAGGRAVRLVIDSLLGAGAMLQQVPKATFDSTRGSVYAGFVPAGGGLDTMLAVKSGGSQGASFAVRVLELFPGLKTGGAGTTWLAERERRVAINNGSLLVKRKTTFTARGAEPVDGTPATRYDIAFTTDQSGTQETPSGTARITGTSNGKGVHYFSAAGIYLGGSREETTQLSVALDIAPAAIPIEQRSSSTVSVLK